MATDARVIQTIGEPSCLVAASMNALETMSGRAVTEPVTPVYQAAVEAGLYANTADVPAAILRIMAFVGQRGVRCEDGVVHGHIPYASSVTAMVEYLRQWPGAFVFWYDPENGQGTHAVASIGVDGENLVTVNQIGALPAETWAFPLAWALQKGLGAFAYASHSFVPDPPLEEPMPDYLPPGVDHDAFGEWREASKANRTDYTDGAAFVTHLAALGADSTDLRRWGFPTFDPTPNPPESRHNGSGEVLAVPPVAPTRELFSDFRCLQVWQNYDAAKVAGFCLDAGLNAVMVKALDGDFWMGQSHAGNPASGEAVGAQRDFFHSLGLRFGVWTNPLFGDDAFLERQAVLTATAAMWADFIALDTEPYDGFWGSDRPAGKAQRFIQRVRELAPHAPLIWQPDPRPHQIARLRPDEWAPAMDAYGAQHYFDLFGTAPEAEVTAAAAGRDVFTPNAPLIPTFSIEKATPDQVRRATAALKAVGGDGFILWRYGLAGDGLYAQAAIEGWG